MNTFRPSPRKLTKVADVAVSGGKILASSGKLVTTAAVLVDRTETAQ